MIRKRNILLVIALSAFFILINALPALAADFTAKDFQDSSACRSCHGVLFEQWQPSMHSLAFSDEIYQKEIAAAVTDLGGPDNPEAIAVQNFCLGCHTPIGLLTGDLPPKTAISATGVSCDFCHTVTGVTGVGNASFVNQPGPVKRGPYVDAVSPAHETALSTLHTKSEFCSACHDVYHPTNGIPLETTYTEWKEGPYPAQDTQCQHCMMGEMRNTQAAIMGPTREVVFRHEFAGGNYLLGNKDKVMERLRSAATLTLNLDKKDPQPGDKVKISVKLTNSGAGHKLPTGLTYVRDTRLLIQAVDDKGKAKTLYEERFDTVHEDAAGKHDRTVPVWRAVKIFSDNRLAPFESRDYSETYTIPKDAAGDYKLVAKLVYRPLNPETAKHLGIKLPSFVTMAQASKTASVPGGPLDIKIGSWISWIIVGLFIIVIVAVYLAVRKRTRQP